MIHRYKLFNKNIVLDINSGGVYDVDALTYDLIGILENTTLPFLENCPSDVVSALSDSYDLEEINEAYGEVLQLVRDGALFSDGEYLHKFENSYPTEPPIKALCLNIAHDCNLRCAYCFASTGDFQTGRKLMSFDTAKAAIDFVIGASKSRKNIEIDFFGGEPLMNFDVVKKTVEYARLEGDKHGKNFRFTITTNGVLLDDKKSDFINQYMDNVVLSLDGEKEKNDRVRYFKDGTGTYDLIVPKYKRLVSNRDKDYYVRGTYTALNTKFSDDVFHLAKLGFKNTSVEPVVLPKDNPMAIREEHLDELLKEYEVLSGGMLDLMKEDRGFRFFHFMLDLKQGPCVIKRIRGCGAGNEYVAVTPEGDIYPCHQFVGQESFKLGNLQSGITNSKVREQFSHANIFAREDCMNCWAKLYCGGGCLANNYHNTDDINKVYKIGCELEKKRVECAIWLAISLSENNGR